MDYWLIETGDTQPGINGGLSRRQEGDAPATTNTIDVASLDDAMEAVKRAGGEIIQDRMPIPGVGWFAAFTDTEGNRFGLMQSDDAARRGYSVEYFGCAFSPRMRATAWFAARAASEKPMVISVILPS